MYRVEIARVDICHRNAQVKFEFGYGPLILTVIPFEITKKYKIFSFH
jgi:hypothetical protein